MIDHTRFGVGGIKRSSLSLIRGAGRTSNFEAPAVFNALLPEFLAATIRDTIS